MDLTQGAEQIRAMTEALGAAAGPDAVADAAVASFCGTLGAERGALLEGSGATPPRCVAARGLTADDRAALEATVGAVASEAPPELAGWHFERVSDPEGGWLAAAAGPVDEARRALARAVAAVAGFALARIRAEAAARARADELQAVLDTVPDAIVVMEATGRARHANVVAAGLVGAPSSAAFTALSMRGLTEGYPLIDVEGRRVAHDAMPSERAFAGEPAELIVGYEPGEERDMRWTRIATRPCFDEAGAVRFTVSVIQDVTRARREADARSFLVEVGDLLATSLDLEATFAALTKLVVPRLADWCVLELRDEDGAVESTSIAHRDPTKLDAARALVEKYLVAGNDGSGRFREPGQYFFIPTIPPAAYERWAQSEEQLQLFRTVGLCSNIIVPLHARGRIVGALHLANAESMRAFDAADLETARQLASRAAVAVENARLYGSVRAAKEKLEGALAALDDERGRLAVTLASIGDAVVATDAAGSVTLLNGVAEALTGWDLAAARGRPLAEVVPLDGAVLVRRDGARCAVAVTSAPIRSATGAHDGVVIVLRDVTQQERLEAELARASRLESIGVLAGGIAHDFNNILTSIVSNVALARQRLPIEHPVQSRLAAAERASGRCADITTQLLTFARGGEPSRAVVSIEALLRESFAFALQGSSVRAEFRLPTDLHAIEADSGQIGQVIHNLALNAVQAMPEGGRVRIVAENVALDDPAWLPVRPGRYVRVAVEDEGSGIPAEVLPRVFDPFFTTKPRGSGLGLATSYSIVTRHGGHLGVESPPGRGATFHVLLPAASAPAAPGATVEAPALSRGKGRILVMDDDPVILELAGECLRELGYEADLVEEGAAAIARYEAALAEGTPYDLVVMDLTVPGGIGGKEAVARLRARHPDVRAVVTSGYSHDPVMARPAEFGFTSALWKPYSLKELNRVVGAALGGGHRRIGPADTERAEAAEREPVRHHVLGVEGEAAHLPGQRVERPTHVHRLNADEDAG
jgi:signal transduction histidine kinase/CheY-like chemotaxis protein